MENYQNKKSFLCFFFGGAYCLFFCFLLNVKTFFGLVRTSPVAPYTTRLKRVKIIFYCPQKPTLEYSEITIFHLLVFIHNSLSFLRRLWLASAIIFEGIFRKQKGSLGMKNWHPFMPHSHPTTLFCVLLS